MSHWNIAAAQYRLNHHRVDEHIAHHLRFISAASKLECNLVLFPELSLTGPALPDGQLPAPPDSHQLAPLVDAACAHNVSVIAGTTVEVRGERQPGLAWFTPDQPDAALYPHGAGACLESRHGGLSIVDSHPDLPNIAPDAALFTRSMAVSETGWSATFSQLQRFAHRYAIAVLMANRDGGSALWDARGQLIVRADRGELLLTGRFVEQGWQGDIIPLR
ncbi:carbon-nitrogen hydrolase family protein [Leclercia adecarboxylata]|uniref:nitrilase-related carbon-nitrogen hydrolase n=1 Tax=Leclercia TaxID=83654 RepID=UPI001BDD9BF4|nr:MULTISPECIES: nitrilase-related carbon-nitrogen hydrolase [Leclercia]MCZ7839258.1 carbon-nitrogen hydrolase family protein [Leclercia adecarboxylata]QVV60558.1 carbon-nitrogen hydrolase family protein [Leclercia sp. Colony189]